MKTRALISQFSDSIEYKINDFLSNGIMASCIVVCSVFFSSYELFWVEELTVGSSSYLIYNSRLKIDEHSTRDVLSGSSLREKSVERVIASSYFNTMSFNISFNIFYLISLIKKSS